MSEFPPNSQMAKSTEQPRQKRAPVTSAEARERKRGLGRQFKETFFSGSGRDAASFMINDVVVPAIRDTLHDALQAGLERVIYGERASGRRPRFGGAPPTTQNNYGQVNYPHTPYQSMSKPTAAAPTRMVTRSARARQSFNELIIPSRQEATDVIDMLHEIMSQYGSVSVADLYDLTDVQSSHTDVKWGWTNLQGARAVRQRNGGFLLDLPDPEPLG